MRPARSRPSWVAGNRRPRRCSSPWERGPPRTWTSAPSSWIELKYGIARICAAFHPRPVLVRLFDLKSNKYRDMLGGALFEPREESPMIAWRGRRGIPVRGSVRPSLFLMMELPSNVIEAERFIGVIHLSDAFRGRGLICGPTLRRIIPTSPRLPGAS